MKPLLLFFSLVCVPLFGVAGCGGGDGLQRVIVHGAVSLDGSPVEDGQIRFVPIKGTAGPATISPVREGRYRCDYHGGVPVGKHRVEILAWDPSVPPPQGPGGPVRPQWAAEKYNRQSELTFQVENSSGVIAKNWEL